MFKLFVLWALVVFKFLSLTRRLDFLIFQFSVSLALTLYLYITGSELFALVNLVLSLVTGWKVLRRLNHEDSVF
ncbi:hypothetical protein [Hydrogenivirga sp.]